MSVTGTTLSGLAETLNQGLRRAIRQMHALPLVCLAALASCQPAIPNRVTAEEYSLYSALAVQHFAGKPPERLFFSSRTLIFDPLERYGCGDRLHASNGVSWSLIKPFHALGQAQYPLDFYDGSNLRIPWPSKEVDGFPPDAPGTYRFIGFSRVAFNRDHSEALFAISDSCGGDCGSGGARRARRENGKWTFQTLDCVWTY
jgi:hypothetical protein